MVRPDSTVARTWLRLALLLLPTLLFLALSTRATVDRENRAMKSVGTPEATALARRDASFGGDEGGMAERIVAKLRADVEGALADELQAEQRRIVPWIAAALFVTLLACYRHVGVVLALLAPAAMGIAWVGGIAVLFGCQQNPISVMLPPVLLTVGVASGVHWIEEWRALRRAGHDSREAARIAVRELRRPALLSASTTIVGFLALAAQSIPAVVEFGLLAALGVALTYGLAIVALPLLLPLLAPRGGAAPLSTALATIRGARLDALARTLAGHSRSIRVGALLLAIAAVAAWTRLEVDNDPLKILPAGHPARVRVEQTARAVGGNELLDVLVPAGSPLTDDAKLVEYGAEVRALPGIVRPIGEARHAQNGDALLRYLLAPGGSRDREALFDAVEARAGASGAGDVVATGLAVQIARDSGKLIRNTLRGAGGGMVLLVALFWAGLRSLRFAWLAMVPNVLLCLVVYGGMALLSRPLTVATAMISSVLLGLVVDDTIHLLHRYRELARDGLTPLAAVATLYRGSARAVVITSAVLAIGFSLCWLGDLSTTTEFGVLAAVTIVVALLCDIVLIPALLVAPRHG